MRRIIHTLGHSLGHTLGLTLAPALLALAAGCNAYRLEPPAGFAQVYAGDDGAHMKANNNVGLRINVFDNVEGGTLTFWSRDMVEKLGRRDYQLIDQKPAETKNGVVGTRFDFSYTPVGDVEPPRFYTAVLFVSDKHIVVLQLAGLESFKPQYAAQIDGILDDLKVRGCKLKTKACKGPQPERLSTPVKAAVKAEAVPETEAEAETKTAEDAAKADDAGKAEDAAKAKPAKGDAAKGDAAKGDAAKGDAAKGAKSAKSAGG
jgi:hypothetical protein